MPFQFIDGNILKSCRMGLTNHTWPVSHYIMSLVINALGGGHTDTHTHINRQTKRFQETRCAQLKVVHTGSKTGTHKLNYCKSIIAISIWYCLFITPLLHAHTCKVT